MIVTEQSATHVHIGRMFYCSQRSFLGLRVVGLSRVFITFCCDFCLVTVRFCFALRGICFSLVRLVSVRPETKFKPHSYCTESGRAKR